MRISFTTIMLIIYVFTFPLTNSIGHTVNNENYCYITETPPSDLGYLPSNSVIELPFSIQIPKARQITVIVMINYTLEAWSYIDFNAYIDDLNVSDQFVKDFRTTYEIGELTLRYESLSLSTCSLFLNVRFKAGLLNGTFTINWRIIFMAFEEPPNPPLFEDKKGKTSACISGPYFWISIEKHIIEVELCTSASLKLYILTNTSYDKHVNLYVKDAPPGITVSFNPQIGTPNFTSEMIIDVGDNAPLGAYLINIAGIGEDGKCYSVQLEIIIGRPMSILLRTITILISAIVIITNSSHNYNKEEKAQ